MPSGTNAQVKGSNRRSVFCRQASQQRSLSLVISMESREKAEGMCAEEMMCRFVVDLAGYSEKRKELVAAEDGEGVRVQVNDLGRG